MHRLLSISVIAGLALGAGGSAMAQSRTVSTANMPKPGVSYIAGPSGPVNTVSTGFLPQPAHLTVGAQVQTGSYDSQTTAYANGDGGWVDQGGSYGGGYYSGGYGSYPPGYGYNQGYGNYPGYGHDHDDDHGHDHGHGGNGHDHGGNGYPSRPPGNAVSVGVKPQPVTNNGGYAIKVAPSRPPPRNNGNQGWNSNPSPPSGSGPGNGFQPGPGVPVHTVNPSNGYGRGR